MITGARININGDIIELAVVNKVLAEDESSNIVNIHLLKLK